VKISKTDESARKKRGSLILAMIIVELLLPSFNAFTGKTISSGFIVEPIPLCLTIGLGFFIGILSGIYPAFFLSSFDPIKILKGTLKSGAKSKYARKILVVTQFTISIALIIGSIIVFAQLRFLRNVNLGFNKEQVVIISSVQQVTQNYEAFKNELLQSTEIKYVTAMDYVLGVNHNTYPLFIEGLDQEKPFFYPALIVRHDFIEVFDIEILEGRGFSKEFATDTVQAIIINEALAQSLSWTNKEAIGKSMKRDGDERVIGVMKNFNALSLHKPPSPFFIDMVRNPNNAIFQVRYLAIRVNSTNYVNVLQHIEDKWKQFAPTRPFEYSFLDKEIDALYKNEEKFGEFSIILTFLTIFIASLGLIGLTSFLAEQRTKEIGIRRALGSSVIDIVKLISKEFIILIVISNLIAWPLAYFVIDDWLQNFSKQIPISASYFIVSGVIALFIALLISGHRAIKSTRVNPASILKYE
jgi:putative ABC transport system permease protein